MKRIIFLFVIACSLRASAGDTMSLQFTKHADELFSSGAIQSGLATATTGAKYQVSIVNENLRCYRYVKSEMEDFKWALGMPIPRAAYCDANIDISRR